MIPDEQVARIRRLFHAEHWKIGTIAAELLLHPATVRRALGTGRFRSQPRLRAQLTDPYLDFLRQTLQRYPRLRATPSLSDDRVPGLHGQCQPTPPCCRRPAPPRREAFLRLRTFPGRSAGQLGVLRRSLDGPRPPAFVRSRPHPLLQSCPVVGILLRPEPGEFSPRPRPCFSRLGWSAEELANRQSSQCGLGTPRRCHSFSSPLPGTLRPLPLRYPPLPPRPGQ